MQTPSPTKYVYQIRCRNGAIVENLQIYGKDEEEARRKLQQMYHHCEILDERVAQSERLGTASFEDVLNLITESR
jgi:histone acetyltransferase (RNA polymerase elongator complex component)